MIVIWKESAVRRLNLIYQYIASKNPAAAVRLYNNFLDATERLRDFPRLASLEPILDSEPEAFRSLVVAHHYKVIYYFDNETVYIIDLWDCRQSPSRLRKLLNKEKK